VPALVELDEEGTKHCPTQQVLGRPVTGAANASFPGKRSTGLLAHIMMSSKTAAAPAHLPHQLPTLSFQRGTERGRQQPTPWNEAVELQDCTTVPKDQSLCPQQR
jgi:hypothetical protein